ncbi:MAG: hypothetical protein IE881_07200 [Epsilonproteobacteria bacterium]|nr:hypothetical protein [Campylobacterota bacterium]
MINKIILILTLIIFGMFVVPSGMKYFENSKALENKELQLSNMATELKVKNIEAKEFDEIAFTKETKSLFTETKVSKIDKNVYKVVFLLNKNQIDKLHSYLETVAFKYLVKIDGAIEYQENNGTLKVIVNFKNL